MAMTLTRCTELLRELQALERIALAIAGRGTDPDWDFALLVLSDRCYWVHAVLQQEDPHLVKAAADALREERLQTSASMSGDRHLTFAGHRPTIH